MPEIKLTNVMAYDTGNSSDWDGVRNWEDMSTPGVANGSIQLKNLSEYSSVEQIIDDLNSQKVNLHFDITDYVNTNINAEVDSAFNLGCVYDRTSYAEHAFDKYFADLTSQKFRFPFRARINNAGDYHPFMLECELSSKILRKRYWEQGRHQVAYLNSIIRSIIVNDRPFSAGDSAINMECQLNLVGEQLEQLCELSDYDDVDELLEGSPEEFIDALKKFLAGNELEVQTDGTYLYENIDHDQWSLRAALLNSYSKASVKKVSVDIDELKLDFNDFKLIVTYHGVEFEINLKKSNFKIINLATGETFEDIEEFSDMLYDCDGDCQVCINNIDEFEEALTEFVNSCLEEVVDDATIIFTKQNFDGEDREPEPISAAIDMKGVWVD